MIKSIIRFTSPIKYLLIGFLLFLISSNIVNINGMIVPVNLVRESEITNKCFISKNLKFLGVSDNKVEKLKEAILIASNATSIKEELIIALVKTESEFINNAVSSKNYKGLMQTPTATFIYSDVDILHGTRILEDKLRITKGNLLKALTLYKGGNNNQARKYAKQTLTLYKKLVERNKKEEFI